MGRISVNVSVTLDGVAQAPGSPDEDPRGGFVHGGWATSYRDEVGAQEGTAGMAATSAMLFGRHTYERFHAFWGVQTDGNPFTAFMRSIPKYVASTSLGEDLPWEHSQLLGCTTRDAVVERVRGLREEAEGVIAVLGSIELVRSLDAAGLVDEYRLSVHPLVLGSGTHLFPQAGPMRRLRLVTSATTTTGVIMATYEPVPDPREQR